MRYVWCRCDSHCTRGCLLITELPTGATGVHSNLIISTRCNCRIAFSLFDYHMTLYHLSTVALGTDILYEDSRYGENGLEVNVDCLGAIWKYRSYLDSSVDGYRAAHRKNDWEEDFPARKTLSEKLSIDNNFSDFFRNSGWECQLHRDRR